MVALAAAERHHADYLATLIPAALAAGSLTGGLLYGRRRWPGSPARQLLLLAGGLFLGALPMLADPAPAAAVATAVLPGLFLAPLLVTGFHALDDLVPPNSLAEASAWLIACLGLGQAGKHRPRRTRPGFLTRRGRSSRRQRRGRRMPAAVARPTSSHRPRPDGRRLTGAADRTEMNPARPGTPATATPSAGESDAAAYSPVTPTRPYATEQDNSAIGCGSCTDSIHRPTRGCSLLTTGR